MFLPSARTFLVKLRKMAWTKDEPAVRSLSTSIHFARNQLVYFSDLFRSLHSKKNRHTSKSGRDFRWALVKPSPTFQERCRCHGSDPRTSSEKNGSIKHPNPVFQDVQPPDLSDFAVVSPSQITIIAEFIAYKWRYDDWYVHIICIYI